MFKMFKAIGQVSHVPVNPELIPPISYEDIEVAKKFFFDTIKISPHILASDTHFFGYSMGRKTNRLLGCKVSYSYRSDARGQALIIIIQALT